ncbi:hypothetical protein GCM10027217_31120 [Pseudomaricurvus hydrocarbonicus]
MAAVLALIVAGYFVVTKNKPEPTPQVVQPEVVEPVVIPDEVEEAVSESPAPVEPRPVEEPLLPTPPSLDGSDDEALAIVESLSPQLVQWLVPEEQVRKWVLVVDMLAAGKLPQRHKPIDFPMPGFAVQALGDDEYLAAETNSQRVTVLIDAVTAIPPRTLGRYYREWLPLLEKAYGELGKEDSFRVRMNEAVARILAVEDVDEEAVLVQPHVFYEYEDKSLEQKSALDKALWRMGKDNREKLQAYLKELKFYL